MNAKIFIKHLKTLSKKMGGKPFALFLDQLPAHRTKKVAAEAQRLQIKLIFNVGYSPEYSMIEAVFSQCKRKYKATRLNALVNNKCWDVQKEVRKSFAVVTKELVVNCAKRSYALMQLPRQ